MPAQLIPLWGRPPRTRDWSTQEIAQFYRVEAALVQAGIRVETDRGLSDEEDPWFVFCRADDGEVIVHFARTSAGYVIAAAVYDHVVTGSHFGRLVEELVDRFPVSVPRAGGPRSNVVLHPSAMLIALIATAVFKMGDARAATRDDVSELKERGSVAASNGSVHSNQAGLYQPVLLESAQAAALMSAVIYAMTTEASHFSNNDQPSSVAVDHSTSITGGFYVPATSVDGGVASSMSVDFHVGSASVVAEAAKVVALVDIMLGHALATEPTPVAPRLDADKIVVPGSVELPSIALSAPNVPRAPEKAPDAADTSQHLSEGQSSTPVDHVVKSSMASELIRLDLGKVSVGADSHIVSASSSLPNDVAALLAKNGDAFGDLMVPVATDPTIGASKSDAQNPTEKSAAVVPSDVTTKDTTAANTPVLSDPAQAEQVVLQFMSHTQHLGFVTNGTMVVLYDQDDVQQHSADIISLSFHFADGSTISLVGLHLNDYSWI